jgi:hypothetical protein
MSDDGIFCRIVEYEISWPQNIERYFGADSISGKTVVDEAKIFQKG